MPGYGYRAPEWFESLIEVYLTKRKNLVKTFLLIDGNIGFQHSDEVALSMLEEYRIPYALVLTKIDKAADSRRLKNVLHLKNVRDKCASVSCFPQIFMIRLIFHAAFSSETNALTTTHLDHPMISSAKASS
ncbi:GTP-binding protein 8-like isoform X1 [Stegodyphus dumicola]|uniref:GTP-binding protein 8-like isoform X1 n=1 Tax=Stegodyphus dumicola TaxID=202533 RepID=UPI0015A7F171|nr:GTP-binding protein 8-like isoform X1 [Stegodyphus dumicola]